LSADALPRFLTSGPLARSGKLPSLTSESARTAGLNEDPPFFARFESIGFLDHLSGLLEAAVGLSIEVIAGQ
jgi:hypothetical protein